MFSPDRRAPCHNRGVRDALDAEPEETEASHPAAVDGGLARISGAAAAPMSVAGDGTATSTARNAFVLAGATIVSRLAMFGLAVAMGRALGAGDYGRYGFASAIAVVLVPISDIGITPYLMREVAQVRDVAETVLPRLLRIKLLLGLVVTLVVSGIAALIVPDATMTAIVVLVVVASLVDGTSLFVFSYFRGRERMGFEAWLTALTASVRSLVGICLVLATGRLLPVLVWILGVSGAQLIVALVRLRKALRQRTPGPRAPAAVHWRTVSAIGWFAILTMIYSRADSVLVGSIKGDRVVGLYTAAYTIMLGLQIAPWMMSTALSPVFARTRERERPLFEASWHQGMRAVMAVALPLSLVTTLLGQRIMSEVFGPEFTAAGTAVAILVWASPLAAFNTIVTAVLRAAHREDWLIRSSLLGVVLNVGLNLWAIPAYGIDGAAAITIGTEALVTIVLGGLAVRHGIVPLPRVPYKGFLVSLGALAAVALLAGILPLPLLIAAALVSYGAALVLTRVVGADDLQLLRRAVAVRTAA